MIVTVPLSPSTSTMAPSGMRRVASTTDGTQGMPSSRLTMTAWLSAAPTSTTTAEAGTNKGVHDGSVPGATSTSPGSSADALVGVSTIRARPLARPGQPGTPEIVSPTATPFTARDPLAGHAEFGGASPLMMNGGSRDAR